MDMIGMASSAATADSPSGGAARPSRYESQKRRDWQTFGQYLRNHRPPLELSRCSGAHVLEFLRYLDQFGKTKVHAHGCPFFGHPSPPAPCPCPLRQAWGSLDALVGRLRAAFEEHGGRPESNPFGARAVRLYLRDIRDTQSKARGIAYEKKRRKRASSHHHPKPKQQQQQQQQLDQPPPPAAVAAAALPDMETTTTVPHFLFPAHHAHFLHGHYFLAPAGEQPGSDVAASTGAGGAPTPSAAGGEDLVLAMAAAAAAAEAHAAGCMMPLSVFN